MSDDLPIASTGGRIQKRSPKCRSSVSIVTDYNGCRSPEEIDPVARLVCAIVQPQVVRDLHVSGAGRNRNRVVGVGRLNAAVVEGVSVEDDSAAARI